MLIASSKCHCRYLVPIDPSITASTMVATPPGSLRLELSRDEVSGPISADENSDLM